VAGECAQPELCPLSKVKAGTMVCVRELAAAPNVQDRLREIGLGEAQRIRLLTSEANVICQVCNARVAISQQLAEAILVEPVPKSSS
jgi:Fe2+ transport system protein FeoA